MSLTLRDGRVVFRVGYGGENRLEMASHDKHNTGNWTIVEASRLFDRRQKLENGLWMTLSNYFAIYLFSPDVIVRRKKHDQLF